MDPVSPIEDTSSIHRNKHTTAYTAVPVIESSPSPTLSQSPRHVTTTQSSNVLLARPLPKWERYTQIFTDLWLWEVASIWVSCISLGGIFLVLGLHDGEPLPNWPLAITINALISTLAVVMKSAMLAPVASTMSQLAWHWFKNPRPLSDMEVYNEASRGPGGSLMMLLSIRWRSIASLGAVITILSMAMDPFFQQIAIYEPGPVVVGNSSVIPSRRLFDAGLDDINAHPQVPASMRAAIYQGLFFTGATNDSFAMSALSPRPNCTTGNCTYPEFETLAVCTQCANITDHLSRNWTEGGDFGTEAYNWSLPNGFSTGGIDMSDMDRVIMTASASHNATVLRAGLPLLNYTTIQIPDVISEHFSTEGKDAKIQASAEECMLYWCVQKYRSTIVNGLLNETLLATTSSGAEDVGILYRFSPEGSNASFSIPGEGLMNASSVWGAYPHGTINGSFLVNQNASALITQFVKDTVEGEVTLNGDTNADGHSTDPIVQRMQLGGLPTVFPNLALSMTTAVRGPGSNTHNTQLGADNGTITGWESTTVTYIRVRWWWMTLPVVLEVATVCLFVITLWESRKMRIWKSSVLAVVMHGPKEDEWCGERVDTCAQMEAIAKDRLVRLRRGNDGRERLEVGAEVKGVRTKP